MIDVIIPAYNASKTLGRALASLAAQTDKDFKVTVVDDCSEWDEHCAMIRTATRYENENLDVRVISTPENCGAGMARQYGIDNTDGEWITFLDADDVLMPYAIEAFKAMIANEPHMNMLHSSFYKQRKTSDGEIELIEMQEGHTWLHGKLYRRAFLEKYEIRNNPQFSRWADDSYFNAMCTELTPVTINRLPMYIWTHTDGSATTADPSRSRRDLKIFMGAMYAACIHTLRYKSEIGFIGNVLNNILRNVANSDMPTLDADESALYDSLCKMYDEHGIHGIKPQPQTKRKRIFKKR